MKCSWLLLLSHELVSVDGPSRLRFGKPPDVDLNALFLLPLRFIRLLDSNANPYMIFRMSSRWAGQRLEVLVITASLVTNLFVVLSYGIIPPSLAGLAVSYTIQVLPGDRRPEAKLSPHLSFLAH